MIRNCTKPSLFLDHPSGIPARRQCSTVHTLCPRTSRIESHESCPSQSVSSSHTFTHKVLAFVAFIKKLTYQVAIVKFPVHKRKEIKFIGVRRTLQFVFLDNLSLRSECPGAPQHLLDPKPPHTGRGCWGHWNEVAPGFLQNTNAL